MGWALRLVSGFAFACVNISFNGREDNITCQEFYKEIGETFDKKRQNLSSNVLIQDEFNKGLQYHDCCHARE